MSKKLGGKLLISAVAAAAAVTVMVTGVNAQSANSSGGNALRVSPVRNDLTINPGSSKTIDIFVQNLTNSPATLDGIVNDFTASDDESGNPAILLDPNKFAPTHSLKRYIATIDTFTLKPKEQKAIKVTITIPKGTAGGGYFGAVRFAPSSTTSEKNVTLPASVGSIILVKVPGNYKEEVKVASFDVRKADKANVIFTNGKSLDGVVRFQNVGDIQEEPFGKMVLKKGDKTLGTYEINNTQPRGNVLPDSIRKFSAPLKDVGSFGKYTLEGNFGYGSSGQLLTAKTTFYIVPLAFIIAAAGVILLILFAIFVLPRLIRRYNRSVIRRASNSRRR